MSSTPIISLFGPFAEHITIRSSAGLHKGVPQLLWVFSFNHPEMSMMQQQVSDLGL